MINEDSNICIEKLINNNVDEENNVDYFKILSQYVYLLVDLIEKLKMHLNEEISDSNLLNQIILDICQYNEDFSKIIEKIQSIKS